MQKKIGAKNNWEEYISDNVLDLSLLQLSEFPAKNKIILPKIVTCLNLSNNLLMAVPPHLCMLIQIREMDLSKNKLKSLPEQFGDLVNLKKLDLYDNQLSFLPLSFHKLQKLKWLDISSNPIPQALLSIAGPCTNSKECEKAAQNIVKYFGVLNTQVSKEFEMAKKAEKEKAVLLEQAEIKMELKSRKQKIRNAEKRENESKGKVDTPTATPSEVTTASKMVRGKRIWLSALIYIIVFTTMAFLYMWVNDLNVQEIMQCLKTGNNCTQFFLN